MAVGENEDIEGGEQMSSNDHTVQLSLAKLVSWPIKDCVFQIDGGKLKAYIFMQAVIPNLLDKGGTLTYEGGWQMHMISSYIQELEFLKILSCPHMHFHNSDSIRLFLKNVTFENYV